MNETDTSGTGSSTSGRGPPEETAAAAAAAAEAASGFLLVHFRIAQYKPELDAADTSAAGQTFRSPQNRPQLLQQQIDDHDVDDVDIVIIFN